jgi:hypothetical protein
MLSLIRSNEEELPPEPLRPGYFGPETARGKTVYVTADDLLTIGLWSYDGSYRSEHDGHNHHIWIVTSGSVEVEADGSTCSAGQGDVLVFEAPYGPKDRVSATADFRAVWLTVARKSEAAN